MKIMAGLKAQDLVVCKRCHDAIHAGRPTRTREAQEELFNG